MAINRMLTDSGGGGAKLDEEERKRGAQREIQAFKENRKKGYKDNREKNNWSTAVRVSDAGTGTPMKKGAVVKPRGTRDKAPPAWTEIPDSGTGTPVSRTGSESLSQTTYSGQERKPRDQAFIDPVEKSRNDSMDKPPINRFAGSSRSADTYAQDHPGLLGNVPKVIGNFAAGFSTGEGEAADFYADEVRNARQAGADLKTFLNHPLETIDTWFAGEAAGFGPNYPEDGYFNRVAESSRKNLLMNLYRTVMNEDLAATFETGRVLSDAVGEIPGIHTDRLTRFMDEGADAARRDAATSRERVYEDDSGLSKRTADKLIRWSHAATGAMLENCMGIPAQLPLLIRQFSGGVQKAQDAGESTQTQITRGLMRAGTAYALNTLLKGFRLTAADKQAVNTALTEMSTDPLLLAAAEQAEGAELYPVLHTAVESLVPVVGDIVNSTQELLPIEIYETVHGYIAESIFERGNEWLLSFEKAAGSETEAFGEENGGFEAPSEQGGLAEPDESDLLNDSASQKYKITSAEDLNDLKNTLRQNGYKTLYEAKPYRSPVPLKWIKNGGSIEIELSDEHITWTYTTAEGVSVPYVDGYVVFPEEYLYPGIKDIDIGVFRGRRQDSISVDNYLTTRYNISLKQCSDYCVHHDIANGRIQLVQEKIHEQFCHVGGIYLFLKEGLLNADQTE